MKLIVILLLATGCSSSLRLATIERTNAVLRQRITTLQDEQMAQYIELNNAEEALRKFEHKTEMDWPLPPCKGE